MAPTAASGAALGKLHTAMTMVSLQTLEEWLGFYKFEFLPGHGKRQDITNYAMIEFA